MPVTTTQETVKQPKETTGQQRGAQKQVKKLASIRSISGSGHSHQQQQRGFYSIRRRAVRALLDDQDSLPSSLQTFDESVIFVSPQHTFNPRFPVKTDLVYKLTGAVYHCVNLISAVQCSFGDYPWASGSASNPGSQQISDNNRLRSGGGGGGGGGGEEALRTIWTIVCVWAIACPLIDGLAEHFDLYKHKYNLQSCRHLDLILMGTLLTGCLWISGLTDDPLVYVSFVIPNLLMRHVKHTEVCPHHLKIMQSSVECNYRHRCSSGGSGTDVLIECQLLLTDLLRRTVAAIALSTLQCTCWPLLAWGVVSTKRFDTQILAAGIHPLLPSYRIKVTMLSQIFLHSTQCAIYLWSEIVTLDLLIALQKNTQHLGYWKCLQVPNNRRNKFKTWTSYSSENRAITKGTIARHEDSVYIAVGLLNSARPGCLLDMIVYKLFSQPWVPVDFCLLLQLGLMIVYLGELYRTSNYTIIVAKLVQLCMSIGPFYNLAKKGMTLRGLRHIC